MDFKKFYDEQKEYSAFRNDREKRNDYEIKVRWKTEQLVKLVPAHLIFDNILEIGCAIGILLNNIAEHFSIKNIFGLDISSENIKVARDLYPDGTFFQGTIDDLSTIFRNKAFTKFDLVILSDIIEHVPDDLRFLSTVKEISSYVLINLPLEKCYKNRNRKYGMEDPSGHLRCYDEKEALSLINKAGLNIINSFTANALNDKDIFKIYLKEREERLRNKSLAKRLFWTLFYFSEDRAVIMNNRLNEKINGTNLFCLVKS
jgi:SAM-dependent methyltransferase